MGRRCSHCGNNGHNSRTCSNYGGHGGGGNLKLFRVQLHVASSSMKKSFSTDCLSSFPNYLQIYSSSPSSSSSSSLASTEESVDKISGGYLSDCLVGTTQERKKGVPWTQEEHKTFLIGLQKLGKGDWRGISHKFVITKTPTQVASHAQKYFLRQNTITKKKRRSSLFDVVQKFETPSCFHESIKTLQCSATEIDLNSTETDTKYTKLPPSLMAKPRVHLPQPNLELTMSLSRDFSL